MNPSRARRRALTWRGRAMNILGEARALVREEPYLDRNHLLDFARMDTGLDDFGATFEPELLDLLVESARGANLAFLGRRDFSDSLGTTLAIRLHYVEARKRHPEIFERPVRPPLIVTGPPRTGTTLLQNLLALHPEYDAIPIWELRRPVPPELLGRDEPDGRRELAERVSAAGVRYVNRRDHIHYARATTPGECIVLMLPTLRSYGFMGMAPLYPYMDEILASDGRRQYAEYVELLKLLQYSRPDRHMLLKAPAHAPYVDRILELMPDAKIVTTHRDLVPTTLSLLSLHQAGFSRAVKRYDVRAHTEKIFELFEFGLHRHFEARAGYEASIHDIDYADLVEDPVGVVRGIYERFGVHWPAGHEKQIERYLRENPQGKHGRHVYRASDFGVTEEEIRKRLGPLQERLSELVGPTRR